MLKKILTATAVSFAIASAALAQDTLYVYGPGGPAPAMKEAAAAFEKETGTKVEVTAGPTPKWLDKAKNDADLIFSGSETMMTDFVYAMEDQLSHQQVTPLYLRPLSILVRPGNPRHIKGLKDILKPGIKVLVVNGAGQNGVWEDMAGRKGDIRTVTALRNNIAAYSKNSAEAKQTWIDNKDIDVWLIWNIWQVSNPQLADVVPIERDYVIYRDTGIAITKRAENKPSAKAFAQFLGSPAGARIFTRWGWQNGRK
ncbi:MAG: substrate-binding domain-containing protein [Sulfuriferula sp.]